MRLSILVGGSTTWTIHLARPGAKALLQDKVVDASGGPYSGRSSGAVETQDNDGLKALCQHAGVHKPPKM